MDITLSHITALEMIRQPYFPKRLANSASCPTSLPDRMPRKAELIKSVSANPQLKNATLPLHVLVGPDCPRNRTKLVCPHVFSATPPSGSFVSLAPGIRCVSPLLLPVLMAPHLTHNELVLLLAELLGVYVVNPSASKGLVQRARPLISPDQLRAFLDELGSARGTAMVRAALDETPVGAASPMEAKLYIRSTRGFSKGGYHFGEVALNDPVEVRRLSTEIPEFRVRKPDLILLSPGNPTRDPMPFRGVAFDYHGEWHTDPEQVKRDTKRGNELLASGIKSYVLWKSDYDNLDYMDSIMERARRDLGLTPRKLSRARAAKERRARKKLHAELERIDGVHWSGFPDNRRRAAEELGASFGASA